MRGIGSLIAVGALAAALTTGQADAAQIACDPASTTPDAEACVGFDGNLNKNDPQNNDAELNAAIDTLLENTDLEVGTVKFTDVEGTKDFFAGSGDDPTGTITFDEALFGNQIISAHFGKAGRDGVEATFLFLFDFGTTGATSVSLGRQGFSNAILVTPPGSAVPEPGTWGMMLIGFGAVGYAMRRRRRSATPVLFQVA